MSVINYIAQTHDHFLLGAILELKSGKQAIAVFHIVYLLLFVGAPKIAVAPQMAVTLNIIHKFCQNRGIESMNLENHVPKINTATQTST